MLGIVLCISLFLTCTFSAIPETYMVKMRDGIELNTVVLRNSSSPRAVVLMRTPYGADSLLSSQEYYVSLGYNTAAQDFRGRYKSQGAFDFWNHSSPDAYDTMEWIVGQTWSNKVIFTQGGSANGIACYLQAEDQPPWLKAQWVVFGTGNMYDTTFQGGAYRQSLISGWLTGIDEVNYISNILNNEVYNPFWTPLNDSLFWTRIKWPAIHTTGWYDIFSQQQLDAYQAYRKYSPEPYNEFNFLVVGPGGHCSQGGEVPWPLSTYDGAISVILSDLLFEGLRGDNIKRVENPAHSALALSYIYYYVMGPILASGEIGNYWTNASTFPTPNYVKMYLNKGNTLDADPPTNMEGNTTFIYDPKNPVPTYGGNNLLLPQCGPWNQASLEKRDDVISFTSTTFTGPVAITGKVLATLYVSSNCTDTDFTVKYTDVYPNGTSMLIQDGIIRMRWRGNNTEPIPMEPGKIYPVVVDLWSTSYIFNTGHALRVSVSSSNAPRFSANTNNFQPLNNPGEPLVAANTIYYSQMYPSYVEFPVVPIPPPIDF